MHVHHPWYESLKNLEILKENGANLEKIAIDHVDVEKIDIKCFIEQGYLSNILIATDVYMKTHLHKYGGRGYDYILTNIVHMMLDEGIEKEDIDIILRKSPKKFLEINE